MCVGSDLDGYPQRLGSTEMAPIQIEPVRIGVELDCRADLSCFLEDRVEIHVVRWSREQQASGRMSEDGQVWIVEGGEQPLGHRDAVHREAGVNRAHHEIEAVENLVRVIESSVGEDIGLDSFEDTKTVRDFIQLGGAVPRRPGLSTLA